MLAEPGGRARLLLVDGYPQLPSAVCLTPAGTLVVGRAALYAARFHPDAFEPYPKRRIDEGVLLLGGRVVPVVDAVAAAYRQVAVEAARVTGGAAIGEVVLTYPATWGASRRQTLLDAAGRVGWGRVRLVAEPVAAAAAFVAVHQAHVAQGAYAVVYDLGASTFDAAVVRREAGGFVVCAAGGLADLGGVDIDDRIVGHLAASYSQRAGEHLRGLLRPATAQQRQARWQLLDDVRTAKELLATAPAVLVRIPGVDEGAPLGREQLDQLTRPLLERTVRVTRALVDRAGLDAADPYTIFPVGGSTRLPLVATLLSREFQRPPTMLEQPELVVAEGGLHTTDRPASPATPPPPTGAIPLAGRRRNRWPARPAAVAGLVVVTLLAAAGAFAGIQGWDLAGLPGWARGPASTPSSLPAREPVYAYQSTLLSGRPICAAVWNPAGTRYAVTSDDTGLEIFNQDGVLVRRFEVALAGEKGCYLNQPGVYWDPGGTTVAVVGGNKIGSDRLHLFNADTGEHTVAQPGPGVVWDTPAWDSTGSAVAVKSRLNAVLIRNDGSVVRNLLPSAPLSNKYSVGSVSLSPHGDTFAISWFDLAHDDGPLFEIRRYTDATPVSSMGMRSDSGDAEMVTYNPDGTLVAVGINEFGVEVWDPVTLRRVTALTGPNGSITDVRWSGNGQYLLAVSHDLQQVHLWRTSDWKLLGTLTPHEKTRQGVGVAAAGVSNDGTVMLVPQGARGIDVYTLT
ncbi:Hsp70 family protein [Phytohabitans sp. ZYX-F-186]|uniref:Hsp70 family protein n=1 Tax=Phytohabitans maris TaxID=3071409 RepID=A0ABU0ZCE7_9ACTN|nr:Hsp70 family protein [Phytohabitans sp. ZYX-F-186]MDQ7904658.1 Hsp70 family protein [Phytohabitans sp. ZYX-F-186]